MNSDPTTERWSIRFGTGKNRAFKSTYKNTNVVKTSKLAVGE